MRNISKFFDNYFNEYQSLIVDKNNKKKLNLFFQQILKIKKNKKKVMIVGNGGSAAIASHFSVDLTKNAKIRCTNYNEYDLLTCFANDYGYEKWVEKSLEFYADEGDVLILISASGNSQNMINAAHFAKKNKINKIITFTGNDKDNRLSKLGDINFWVNSKSYNLIENTHQALLLSLVDLIIGKLEYPPN